MRLIDADAYISYVFMELAKAIEEDKDTAPDIAIALATKVAVCIKNDLTDETITPTIEPKQGEWIDKGWKSDWKFETDGKVNYWHEYECSKCRFHNKGSKSNYCHNCGARMKGADDK